jgi:hypothetical protein
VTTGFSLLALSLTALTAKARSWGSVMEKGMLRMLRRVGEITKLGDLSLVRFSSRARRRFSLSGWQQGRWQVAGSRALL